MKKNILFIQGAGEEDYAVDAKIVASLHKVLGEAYTVHYPLLLNKPERDFGRGQQISKEIILIRGEVILVGYSLGASMLLKYISENKIHKHIGGIFLISTLFWSGDEDWQQGFNLREGFADRLPKGVPIFLYHCRDDEVIPFAHLALYAQKPPQATIREIESGGHQLENDLTMVAKDIQSL
jgi:uncharacterized protein